MRAVTTELLDQRDFMCAQFMEKIDDRMVLLENVQRLARENRFSDIDFKFAGALEAIAMLGAIQALEKAIAACKIKARETDHAEVRAALI